MDTTRASLLIRIRDENDSLSWEEFHQLYAPLLYHYARARGLNHADADEIRSACYESIVKHIKQFDYSREKGGFKSWLKRIVFNRVVDLKRKRVPQHLNSEQLNQVVSDQKTPDEMFDEQWKLSHLRFCLAKIELMVPQITFQIFQSLTDDVSVEDICQKQNVNSNQVYKAKSKILKLVSEQMRQIYADEIQGT